MPLTRRGGILCAADAAGWDLVELSAGEPRRRGVQPADAARPRRDGPGVRRAARRRRRWPGSRYVSEAHFIRTFRATFGETPHRYLQRRRVERAMFLLRTTERSVTDICMDVGFSSLGTFSRMFRDIVGEPPSAYRRRGPLPRVPTCFAMALDATEQFRRSPGRVGCLRVADMLNHISITSRSTSSTRTRRSTSTSASSASRCTPTSTSASCGG